VNGAPSRDLFAVDPELEEALEACRRRVKRLGGGRVFVELHVLAGRVIEYRLSQSSETERDIERLMAERKAVNL
jgi:hypothetical protein